MFVGWIIPKGCNDYRINMLQVLNPEGVTQLTRRQFFHRSFFAYFS